MTKQATFIEASHPEFAKEQREARDTYAAQLMEVARAIETHRLASQPERSQNRWVREWSSLGSQKTYSLILAGELDDIAVEKKLPEYRAVLSAIRANPDRLLEETLYEDVPGAQAVLLNAMRLVRHEGKDRFMSVEGGSGSGKTSSLQLLVRVGVGVKIYLTDANETWKSTDVVIRRLLRLFGVPDADITKDRGEMLEKLKSTIRNQGKILLAIDEAHHISGSVINVLKDLLNGTDLRLILAGIDTLFRKLKKNAREEAMQLFHNRLFARIVLAGPDKEWAGEFISRRMGLAAASWKDGTLAAISTVASYCGFWAFTRRLVDQLKASGISSPGDADLMKAVENAKIEVA